MAYSGEDARNGATLTSFNDVKTRYLGTSLMHLGISETPTSIGTFQMEIVMNEIGGVR